LAQNLPAQAKLAGRAERRRGTLSLVVD
jgi:hypothetical protein